VQDPPREATPVCCTSVLPPHLASRLSQAYHMPSHCLSAHSSASVFAPAVLGGISVRLTITASLCSSSPSPAPAPCASVPCSPLRSRVACACVQGYHEDGQQTELTQECATQVQRAETGQGRLSMDGCINTHQSTGSSRASPQDKCQARRAEGGGRRAATGQASWGFQCSS
jgi:hypothetical protein